MLSLGAQFGYGKKQLPLPQGMINLLAFGLHTLLERANETCLHLVAAILMETSEEWESGKPYLTLTPQNRIPNTQNQLQTAA